MGENNLTETFMLKGYVTLKLAASTFAPLYVMITKDETLIGVQWWKYKGFKSESLKALHLLGQAYKELAKLKLAVTDLLIAIQLSSNDILWTIVYASRQEGCSFEPSWGFAMSSEKNFTLSKGNTLSSLRSSR